MVNVTLRLEGLSRLIRNQITKEMSIFLELSKAQLSGGGEQACVGRSD